MAMFNRGTHHFEFSLGPNFGKHPIVQNGHHLQNWCFRTQQTFMWELPALQVTPPNIIGPM